MLQKKSHKNSRIIPSEKRFEDLAEMEIYSKRTPYSKFIKNLVDGTKTITVT